MTTKGRRRWGRWVLLVLGLALVGAVLTPPILSLRADREIARRIERMRAAGEPVMAGDLATPPATDEENAVIELSEAAGQIDGYANASKSPWQAYDQGDAGYPLTGKERPLLARAIQDNAGVFELVDAAMAKPGFYWPNQPTSPLITWMLPSLSPQRGLAKFLAASALYDHDRGDDASALRQIQRTLFVARAMDHHPACLIATLVATGMRAMAHDRLMKIAPDLKIGDGAGEAPPRVMAELIGELLDESDAGSAFRRGFFAERVMVLDATTHVLQGQGARVMSSMGAGGGGASTLVSPVGRFATGPWIRHDLVLILDAETTMGDAALQPDWPTAQAKVAHLSDPIRAAPFRHFWAGMMMPSPDGALYNRYRLSADRRMAATMLAIRWYAAEHGGKLPPSLDVLVPKYLPAVPRDPFVAGAAASIRYISAEPNPRIYSVGKNGIDDGGSDKPTDRSSHPDRWRREDAVAPLRLPPRDMSALPDELKD